MVFKNANRNRMIYFSNILVDRIVGETSKCFVVATEDYFDIAHSASAGGGFGKCV